MCPNEVIRSRALNGVDALYRGFQTHNATGNGSPPKENPLVNDTTALCIEPPEPHPRIYRLGAHV